jgi:DNA-binding CsgD family transcriptional regulator
MASFLRSIRERLARRRSAQSRTQPARPAEALPEEKVSGAEEQSLALKELALPWQTPCGRTFSFDEELDRSLQELARRERRSKQDIASELLSAALAQRGFAEANLELWRALSPREQQVTALVCLGYTNRQIAGQLFISIETVKTHVQNICRKYGLRTKNELRQAMEGWDFSSWA